MSEKKEKAWKYKRQLANYNDKRIPTKKHEKIEFFGYYTTSNEKKIDVWINKLQYDIYRSSVSRFAKYFFGRVQNRDNPCL